MKWDKVKRPLLIVLFGLLTTIAVAGWMREPAMTMAPNSFDNQATAASMNTTPAVQLASTATVRPVATRTVIRRRPWKHSAAIVAGSAGAGAAIGALAGHGKGAAIGALAGGAGGFIYDRLTHKNRVVVRQ